MKIKNVKGINWVEPQHIRVTDILHELKCGKSVDELKKNLNISSEGQWRKIASAVFEDWKHIEMRSNGYHHINAKVNKILADYALCLPPYETIEELVKLEKLMACNNPNIHDASELILSIAMDPCIRALQIVGRFQKLDAFKEFAYFIESATLSYYRGNVAAVLFCLIPIIEGVLLRWQGYPNILNKKPKFEKTIEFISHSIYRQPLPHIPNFFESYVCSVGKILQNHLYKDSRNGTAYNNFNRHLALHMLQDKDFCSPDNVMRAFLLLDLLSEINICEKQLQDPRFSIEREEEELCRAAYDVALKVQKKSSSPENILKEYGKHISIR